MIIIETFARAHGNKASFGNYQKKKTGKARLPRVHRATCQPTASWAQEQDLRASSDASLVVCTLPLQIRASLCYPTANSLARTRTYPSPAAPARPEAPHRGPKRELQPIPKSLCSRCGRFWRILEAFGCLNLWMWFPWRPSAAVFFFSLSLYISRFSCAVGGVSGG